MGEPSVFIAPLGTDDFAEAPLLRTFELWHHAEAAGVSEADIEEGMWELVARQERELAELRRVNELHEIAPNRAARRKQEQETRRARRGHARLME